MLELQPLGAEETQALLARDAAAPASDAVHSGVAQSRGNPLFALQLLHAWAGGGYLKLEGGKYKVPDDGARGRAITTAELWDERLRAVPTDLRLAAYAAAALGDDIRGEVLKALVARARHGPARRARRAHARADPPRVGQRSVPLAARAPAQSTCSCRLHERNDAPAIFRLAANALAKHPASGSRRIMKHRVTNLLRAGDDDVAPRGSCSASSRARGARGRDTAATLRDLELLEGRVTGGAAAEYALLARRSAPSHRQARRGAREGRDGARRVRGRGRRDARGARAASPRSHLARIVGAPAQGRLELVELAISRFEELGDDRGPGAVLVVLGEIDYLLGEHARARARSSSRRAQRCSALDDRSAARSASSCSR